MKNGLGWDVNETVFMFIVFIKPLPLAVVE